MAQKQKDKKRLGKKHRQASTRPKLGRNAPRATATTGAVSPKKRKELAAKKAAATTAAKTPTKSPERERHVVIRDREERGHGGATDEQQVLRLRAARSAQDDNKKNKGNDID